MLRTNFYQYKLVEDFPLTSKRIYEPIQLVKRVPYGKTATDLYTLLTVMQQKQYGNDITQDFSPVVVKRTLKILLDKYPIEDVKRAIMLSLFTARGPFSSKYIEATLNHDDYRRHKEA